MRSIVVDVTSALLLAFLALPSFADTAKPVEVVNPPDQSVPVQEPLEPVNFLGFSVALLSGVTHGEAAIYSVPSDRRLVIEHVFFKGFGTSTSCAFVALPALRLDGAEYVMNPIPSIQTDNGFRAIGSQAMKLYAEPGSSVVAVFDRDTGPCIASGSFTFSGYLEEDLR